MNTRALSFLSSVAGDALTKHLSKILPALLSALSGKMDTPDETEVNYIYLIYLYFDNSTVCILTSDRKFS